MTPVAPWVITYRVKMAVALWPKRFNDQAQVSMIKEFLGGGCGRPLYPSFKRT
jgi:hypothetical protein